MEDTLLELIFNYINELDINDEKENEKRKQYEDNIFDFLNNLEADDRLMERIFDMFVDDEEKGNNIFAEKWSPIIGDAVIDDVENELKAEWFFENFTDISLDDLRKLKS